jgi:hypothetical protein
MKTIFFVVICLSAAAGLAGCASTVTEGPRRDPRGVSDQAYCYQREVEEPAPVTIPQKPGSAPGANYLRQNSPDQPLYTRSEE